MAFFRLSELGIVIVHCVSIGSFRP
jgi:hypothetical protein